MVHRMRHVLRLAAAASLALLAAGCSSEPDVRDTSLPPSSAATATTTAASQTTTPAEPTSTPSSSVARADISTQADIARVIAPLGMQCSSEESALFCTRGADSWQFRISPQRDGDAAFRKSACDSGASSGSEVITDGAAFVVYAGNDGQNLEQLRDELTGLGIGDLQIDRTTC